MSYGQAQLAYAPDCSHHAQLGGAPPHLLLTTLAFTGAYTASCSHTGFHRPAIAHQGRAQALVTAAAEALLQPQLARAWWMESPWLEVGE